MDLRLGCREKIGNQWIYYLRDGSRLSKEKWTELVKQQVKLNEHKQVLEHIKSTVTLWNKQDTVEEIALQVYARHMDAVEDKTQWIPRCISSKPGYLKVMFTNGEWLHYTHSGEWY